MLLVCLTRIIPQVEIKAVSEYLHNLLTGNVDKLPTETLVHKFWRRLAGDQKQANSYRKCLNNHRLTRVRCYNHTTAYCGLRFGEKSPRRIEQCRQLLTNEVDTVTAGVASSIARMFDNYR